MKGAERVREGEILTMALDIKSSWKRDSRRARDTETWSIGRRQVSVWLKDGWTPGGQKGASWKQLERWEVGSVGGRLGVTAVAGIRVWP